MFSKLSEPKRNVQDLKECFIVHLGWFLVEIDHSELKQTISKNRYARYTCAK